MWVGASLYPPPSQSHSFWCLSPSHRCAACLTLRHSFCLERDTFQVLLLSTDPSLDLRHLLQGRLCELQWPYILILYLYLNTTYQSNNFILYSFRFLVHLCLFLLLTLKHQEGKSVFALPSIMSPSQSNSILERSFI